MIQELSLKHSQEKKNVPEFKTGFEGRGEEIALVYIFMCVCVCVCACARITIIDCSFIYVHTWGGGDGEKIFFENRDCLDTGFFKTSII